MATPSINIFLAPQLTGKLAKKAALAAAQARGSILSKAEPTAEEKAAQALREEQRAARGPSLVDVHAAQRAANGKGKGSSSSFSSSFSSSSSAYGGSKQKGSGFDYERDIASHRNKVGSREAQKMLEEARKLDTRFDRSTAPK